MMIENMTTNQQRFIGVVALILAGLGGFGLIGSLLGYLLNDSGLVHDDMLSRNMGGLGALLGIVIGSWVAWTESKSEPKSE